MSSAARHSQPRPSALQKLSLGSGVAADLARRQDLVLRGTQIRSFKRANYVERIGDNERSEELLEALEVRDDEKDTQPRKEIIGESEKNSKWAEDMTKGKLKQLFLSIYINVNQVLIPITYRQNAHHSLPTIQTHHPTHNGGHKKQPER